ncbi:MAG TPA: hypothetical protein VFI47_05835 [Acidimicrobiales bacterium]|nr:hypothetical protein [Acidimicrobiales bacterium]
MKLPGPVRKPRTLVVGAMGLGLGMLAVLALREATLSTHQPTAPGSRVELVVEASAHGEEPGQTLAEMVDARVGICRLEVTSDVVGPIVDEGGGRFRAVLTPALDETNRRQFRGCLEDWGLDHLRVDVVALDVVRG